MSARVEHGRSPEGLEPAGSRQVHGWVVGNLVEPPVFQTIAAVGCKIAFSVHISGEIAGDNLSPGGDVASQIGNR